MENLEVALKSVDLGSQKVEYNPETGTNWCHLSMEMRMECLKRMDIKTRTRLGATSTTEKALVDSKKFHLDMLVVDLRKRSINNPSYFGKDRVELYEKSQEHHGKALACLDQILQRHTLGQFAIHFPEYGDDVGIVNVLFRNAPLQPESLLLGGPIKIIHELANLKRISCCTENPPVLNSLLDILTILAVAKAKHVKMDLCSPNNESVIQIVQEWIDMDVEIGRTMAINRCRGFGEHEEVDMGMSFAHRIVSRKDEQMRIRMNNKSKQALIHYRTWQKQLCAAVIIPADLPESEEDKWLMKA